MLNAFTKPRTLRTAALFAVLVAIGTATVLHGALQAHDRAAERAIDASLRQLASLLQGIAGHQDGTALPALVQGWVRTEPAVVRVQVQRADGLVIADAGRPSDPTRRRSYQVAVGASDSGAARVRVDFDRTAVMSERASIVREYLIEGGALMALFWVLAVFAAARRSAVRRYRMLLATSRLLLTDATEAELMQKICDVAVIEGGFALAWIGLRQSGAVMERAAASGPAIGYLDGLQVSDDASVLPGQGIGGQALRTGHVTYCNDFAADAAMAVWAARARRYGIRASIALPLRYEGELLGLLSFYSRERNVFDAAEVALVEQMAADISLGIGYVRRGASLAESLERLAQIETRVRAGSFRLLLPGGSIWCSAGAAALLGRIAGFSEVAPPRGEVTDADPVSALFDLANASPAGEFEFDLPLVATGEPVRWLRVTGVIEVHGEDRRELRGLVQDVSERKALELGITRIADTERQRIASELHDNLGQILTGTSLLVTMLEHKSAGRDAALEEDLHQVGEMLQQSLAVCRSLAHGAMPDLVHGLGVALEDLARQVAATGIRCDARIAPLARSLHGEQAVELYRIAQEAVTNAMKHSSCHRIEIELKQRDRMLELSIVDDGSGMPLEGDGKADAGLGHRTMRYRAARAGGTIIFRPGPDGGLGIYVRVRLLGAATVTAAPH